MDKILKKGDLIKGTYTVECFIGEGAFGQVYRVKHKFFEEYQVMKIFTKKLINDSDIKKIINEGKILQKLTHRNIVKVLDINTFIKNDQNYYFLTMNFISGESLNQLIKRKIYLDAPAAISIIIDVLSGLKVAHKNEPAIIHKDINPDNILISYEAQNPEGVLGDFGIAQMIEKASKLPNAGGRYGYFAPECFMNIYLPASDVFSCGIVLYKMITGMFPWTYDYSKINHTSNEEVMSMIETTRYKKIKKPSSFIHVDIDKKLENVILKSLDTDIEKRYKTAADFLDDLNNYSIKEQEQLDQAYWQEQEFI